MELSLSLHEHLERSALLHVRLCPRQVIGVRMARLACKQLGLDPALPYDRKKLFVFMEVGHCAANAVIAVTGASPTNGLMRLVDYGKVAATFVDLRTGRAIRVSERQASRQIALDMRPDLPPWQAQLEAYQIMRDEDLLDWQAVTLVDPLPALPGEPSQVPCSACGDVVHDHREVIVNGQIMCKPCAFGAYHRPSTPYPMAPLQQPDRAHEPLDVG